MLRLLKIELLKVVGYRTFWVFLVIYALLIILISGSMKALDSGSGEAFRLFHFPELWHNLTYMASFMNLIPAVLMIMLIANEFSFKTFRQNVIDGLSRENAVMAKFALAALIAIACVLFVAIYGLIRGLSVGEFDHIGEIFAQSNYIFRLLIQMAGYMSIAILLTFFIKKAALSIVVFLLYTLVLERLVRLRAPDAIDKYFPMNALGELVPFPGNIQFDPTASEAAALSPELAMILAVGYILLCIGGSILLMSRSNL